jgi:hypothetical protein
LCHFRPLTCITRLTNAEVKSYGHNAELGEVC